MNIIFHVGQMKTGSSYLQTLFAKNQKLLSEHGIEYPHHRWLKSAVSGRVSSGNLSVNAGWVENVTEACINSDKPALLYSSEKLFNAFVNDFGGVEKLAKTHNVTIIVYVRDPFDHILSLYGQAVKRAGATFGIDSYIQKYDTPEKMVKLIEHCESTGVRLVARNYSNCRQSIGKTMFTILLGDQADAFCDRMQSFDTPVNRSLTRGEYELQRAFNVSFGKLSSEFISDEFVNQLPSVPSENEFVSLHAQTEMKIRLEGTIHKINTFLDAKHQLSLSFQDSAETRTSHDDFQFSADQIRVLAEAISRKIYATQAKQISVADADRLKSIALKCETEDGPSLADAFFMLRRANTVKRYGPKIRRKLKEWKNKL